MSYKKVFRQMKPSTMFMWIALGIFALSNIFPLFFAFFTSFKTNQEFYKSIWALPTELHYENYIEAFFTGKIGEYAINSVIVAVLTLALTIICSTLAAYSLSRLHVPGAEIILTVLILLQSLPTEAILIPEYMIVSRLHLLKHIHLAMSLPYSAWYIPANIVILANFFATVPMDLLESARLDGASEMKTLIKIILPLMKAPVSTCLVLDFCGVWGELMWAQIVTLTSEKGLTLTIGLLNFKGMFGTNWGAMTAAICMISIPLIVIFIFTQKYFVQGLTAGGVKG